MITTDRIEAIYTQMNGYVLELGDPNAFGPRYFIDKIATCRNWLNAVSLVVSELSREKLITGQDLRKIEAIFELESARLLSTDETVRRLANIKDRESMVAHLLRDRKQRIDQLKGHMIAIDAVTKAVTHRSRELHSTMDAIKNQRRFMQIEVSTGSFYGDERVPRGGDTSVGIGPAGVTVDPGFNEAELANIFNEEEAPPAAIVPEEPAPPPVLAPVLREEVPKAPEDDDSAIQAFLKAGDFFQATPSPRVSQGDDDFSALLENV